MYGFKNIYEIVQPIEDPLVDQAMAEALPTAGPHAQRTLALGLLYRGHTRSQVALVHNLHRFPMDLQRHLARHAGQMEQAIRKAGNEDDLQTRQNVVSLVVLSRTYGLSYLLPPQLHVKDPDLNRAAAAGLLELAWWLVEFGKRTSSEDPSFDLPACTTQLASALSEACAGFHRHGQIPVMMAAACLAPLKPVSLMRQILDRGAVGHVQMRRMMAGLDHALVNKAMLYYASHKELAGAATEALQRPQATEHLRTVFSGLHMLAIPMTRSAVRQVEQPGHLLPTSELCAQLPRSQRHLLPRWVQAVRAGGGPKVRSMSQIISTEDRLMRLNGLRALMQMPETEAMDWIVMMCMDADPAIARTALRVVMLRRWAGESKLMGILLGSAHPELRQIAERHLVSVGFEHLWSKWDTLNARTRVAAGLALIKANPSFHRQLTLYMKQRDPQVRFKAVMMARQLRQEPQFEETLLRLCEDRDPKVASAAIGALPGLVVRTKEREELLIRLVGSQYDRICATAVEVAARLGLTARLVEPFQKLARGARGNRCRANAVKALLEAGDSEGWAGLERLLTHGDRRHRISGLWVIEALAILPLVKRVGLIGRSDSDLQVRRFAWRVLTVLSGPSRSGRSPSSMPTEMSGAS